jgi:hypothetical protein
MRFAAGGAFGDEKEKGAIYMKGESSAPLEYYCVDNKRVF